MEETKAMLDETGLPYAYREFAEGEKPELPYCVFTVPQRNIFYADGVVYYRRERVNVLLYTETKDPEIEAALEAVFNANQISYACSEGYVESEGLYEVQYEFEVKG